VITIRVLIVHPEIYVYGGAELVITKLANYLSNKGIENALLTTSILPEMRDKLKGTEIIIPEKQPKKSFITLLSHIYKAMGLQKCIRERTNDFDVINVHNFPAELSVFLLHKPVVWMCNEPPELYLGSESKYRFISTLLKIANKTLLSFDRFVVSRYIKNVVVADEFNAERFKENYNITPNIINYGIDYAFFSQGDGERAKERFGLHDSFVLIQVGMLTSFKNQMESIKTVEALKGEIPDIKLMLVGLDEGEYAEMLKRYVQSKELDPYVIFTDQLPQDEIRDLYHASNVALFPIGPQGGWLSPFEALSANLPIIVSPLMTASSIIKRENIGIITDDFAGAIMSIYNNPEKYQEMAERGQKWVKKNLSWDKFCENMVELFHRSINEYGGA